MLLRSKYNIKGTGKSEYRVEKVVEGLKRKNVKLLALDFDQTLTDIFTSTYNYSAAQVAQRIRPVFVALIKECMIKNIVVAIVTFSSGTEVIARAMELKLSISISSEYGRLEDGEILLRGLDDTWSKPNVTVLPTCWQTLKFNGKLGHIAAIVRQLNSKGTFFSPRGLLIRPSEILYFDDDLKNCEFSIKAQICTAAIPLCETNDLNEIILEDLENYYIHHTGFQKLTVEHARAVALEPGSCCSVM
eukprot:g14720.t1